MPFFLGGGLSTCWSSYPGFVPGKKEHCRNTSELSVVLPYLHFPVLLGESLVNSLTALFRLECRLNDRTEELAGTGFCFVFFFSTMGDTCTLGYTWGAGGRHSGIGVDGCSVFQRRMKSSSDFVVIERRAL